MITEWKLEEWNEHYYNKLHPDRPLPIMTAQEIADAIIFLRDHNYPKPMDCPEQKCQDYRPACKLGICKVAVGMCGDF